MDAPFYLVDAFTDRPFAGNPAGVCILAGPAPEEWMQNLAMEMNQAETAFVSPSSSGFDLRWFTPVAEVDLCGHATLAAAHALWKHGALALDSEALFSTRSGSLRCSLSNGKISMDFPAEPAFAIDVPEALMELIQARVVWVGRNRMDYLIELLSESDVLSLELDFEGLSAFETRGFIFTSACSSGSADFVSRFFAPRLGVREDPVTGSAHCCLGPYWAGKLGKTELMGCQTSSRGGYVGVSVRGERVVLSGSAVTVVRGSVSLPS